MAVLNSVMRAFAIEALPTPAELLVQHPCPADMARHIDSQRHQARRILAGEDDRLLVVIGPCSIHDPVAALDYAGRLARLATAYEDSLQIVMRAYFEKPRTTVGWKGLVFDPHLDGSNDINRGLHLARQVLLDISRQGATAKHGSGQVRAELTERPRPSERDAHHQEHEPREEILLALDLHVVSCRKRFRPILGRGSRAPCVVST